MDPKQAAMNALTSVLQVKPKERLLVICDTSYREIGGYFGSGAEALRMHADILELDDTSVRKELPIDVKEFLMRSESDVYINILRGNSEETPFRISIVNIERGKKKRLGHCPGITKGMFTDGALALSEGDYSEMRELAERLSVTCTGASSVHLTSPSGTDLRFSVKGREFFTDVVVDWESMKWMNLPVGEVMAGPVEDSMEGTFFVDGAVGGMPLFKEQLVLTVKAGKVTSVETTAHAIKKKIEAALDTDEWSRNVGEFAMGINPKARHMKEFLETEKQLGTAHIAFGCNDDFPGGKNTSSNHMDFLLKLPKVVIKKGGKDITVLEDGTFCL